MKEIVLIGTSHTYQEPSNPGADQFGELIEATCRERGIGAIAEEMSLEALREKNQSISICESVADSLCIRHQYSDPNRAQREKLGIKPINEIKILGDLHDWEPSKIDSEIRYAINLREDFWVRNIKELDCWPTLFVCGADHFTSIKQRFLENNLSVSELFADWEPAHSDLMPN